MAKLYALCLLHGVKCRFQRFKTRKYDNAEISLKLCTYEGICSQKLLISSQKLFSRGPCEFASTCPSTSEACKLDYNKKASLLKNRHLFCVYGGKLIES